MVLSTVRAMMRLGCAVAAMALVVVACRDHTPTQTVTAIGTKANICIIGVTCQCSDPTNPACVTPATTIAIDSVQGPDSGSFTARAPDTTRAPENIISLYAHVLP